MEGTALSQNSDTRTTCYKSLVQQAAKHLGLDQYATADDVLRAVVKGQQNVTLEHAKEIIHRALAHYQEHA
jgi:hypothetical protein